MNYKSSEDGESEEEEEEIFVYANFEEGTVDREIFQQPDLRFKMIGVDSNTPIVQLGDTTFRGTWADVVGTKVFFEENLSPEQEDPVFTVIPPKMLKFKCMANKSLELSRIFLKQKSGNDVLSSEETSSAAEKGERYDENGIDFVLDLAQRTTNSNSKTNDLMSKIVEDCTMEISD